MVDPASAWINEKTKIEQKRSPLRPCVCVDVVYRKYDLKICPGAETIRPKMTICPLDEQAQYVQFKDHKMLDFVSVHGKSIKFPW